MLSEGVLDSSMFACQYAYRYASSSACLLASVRTSLVLDIAVTLAHGLGCFT